MMHRGILFNMLYRSEPVALQFVSLTTLPPLPPQTRHTLSVLACLTASCPSISVSISFLSNFSLSADIERAACLQIKILCDYIGELIKQDGCISCVYYTLKDGNLQIYVNASFVKGIHVSFLSDKATWLKTDSI